MSYLCRWCENPSCMKRRGECLTRQSRQLTGWVQGSVLTPIMPEVVHVPKGHIATLNGAPPLLLCHKVQQFQLSTCICNQHSPGVFVPACFVSSRSQMRSNSWTPYPFGVLELGWVLWLSQGFLRLWLTYSETLAWLWALRLWHSYSGCLACQFLLFQTTHQQLSQQYAQPRNEDDNLWPKEYWKRPVDSAHEPRNIMMFRCTETAPLPSPFTLWGLQNWAPHWVCGVECWSSAEIRGCLACWKEGGLHWIYVWMLLFCRQRQSRISHLKSGWDWRTLRHDCHSMVQAMQRSNTLWLVQVARACDLGVNDDRLIVRTHLGGILRPGRRVMGYDLRTVNVRVLKSIFGQCRLDSFDHVCVKSWRCFDVFCRPTSFTSVLVCWG